MLVTVALVSSAQQPPGWNDDVADHLVGTWKLEGTVMGRAAHHTVNAEWVLNHQSLQIREQTARDAPANESRYDASWFLGYDDLSERYVLHLMDGVGARYSETLGFGDARADNNLRFVFEYPDGPFHTSWRWLPESQSWEWYLEQKDKTGQWRPFANFKLTRTDR